MALFDIFKKKTTSQKLNDILYWRLLNDTGVVFYDYNAEDFIEKGYQGNADVYKIVRKIVDKCANAKTYLYTDNEDKKSLKYKQYTKSTTAIDNAKGKIYRAKALDFVTGENDLLKLMDMPNSYQTWGEMIELFRIFYFVQGEAFLYRETALESDIALTLHVAPANLMTPVYSDDSDNIIKAWKLRMTGGYMRELDAKDVLQLKMSNPMFTEDGKQLRGQSPLLAGLKYLQLNDKGLEAWVKSVENEGAKGIISPNHADPNLWLTPEQVSSTEERVQEKLHGIENRNKVVVSGMPLQFTQIGLSPNALSLIEALNHAKVNLCDLWGVPATLFEPNPTYQNQQAAAKRFVADLIIPYLKKEDEAFNRWLVEPFIRRDNKKYVIDTDTSTFEELKMTLEDIKALSAYLTINEIRVMQGWDEIENDYANEIFMDTNKIPMSDYEVQV